MTQCSMANPATGKLRLVTGPHVILGSTTVVENWTAELLTWMNNLVEIFIYSGTEREREALFAPESKWATSSTPMHRRIIVCSYDVLQITLTLLEHSVLTNIYIC
jgi:SNF2 family DNA or RNA helicase